MIKLFNRYITLTPIYILVQILILNQILFSGYINPFLYIILIISLPIGTPKWFLLTYAFLTGFLIDIFSSSIGFHSTACVFIAFLKPIISKISIPHNILGEMDDINMWKIGFKTYSLFALIIIITHHSCLFIIENMDFNIHILNKIISENNKDYITLTQKGILYKKINKLHNAQDCYEQALKINPEYEIAQSSLAILKFSDPMDQQ